MAIISSSKKNGNGCQQNDNSGDCEDNGTATQKSISSARKKYCDELTVLAGNVKTSETNYDGQTILYETKKCLFLWTEDNYRRYRNTEISVGIEIQQSNDNLKENVANYIKWGNDLSTKLKNITKTVKDVKIKLSDLRTAACKLEECKNDSCNCTQITILTGEEQKNCETKSDNENRPPECSDARDVLNDLICMPKALGFDADSIFKAASDVVGIQIFSNIGTLDALQKTLSDESKAFEKLLQDTMKLREGDMKKLQDDLIKTVQATTKSAAGLYNARSDFEGTRSTTRFICCPDCCCDVGDKNCEPRLNDCSECICKICDEVKETFCNVTETNNGSYAN